jgi:hypothetical protein
LYRPKRLLFDFSVRDSLAPSPYFVRVWVGGALGRSISNSDAPFRPLDLDLSLLFFNTLSTLVCTCFTCEPFSLSLCLALFLYFPPQVYDVDTPLAVAVDACGALPSCRRQQQAVRPAPPLLSSDSERPFALPPLAEQIRAEVERRLQAYALDQVRLMASARAPWVVALGREPK